MSTTSKDLKSEQAYLEQIQDLYQRTKKWFIRAEERLPEMQLFVAPLLEHRDAFDHLMRYHTKKCEGASQEALMGELNSVRGHEIRAFNDVADYTCVLIRQYMNNSVRHISRRRIKQLWDAHSLLKDEDGKSYDYSRARAYLIDCSEQLAHIRTERKNDVKHIEDYEQVLERFYQIFDDFRIHVEPYL